MSDRPLPNSAPSSPSGAAPSHAPVVHVHSDSSAPGPSQQETIPHLNNDALAEAAAAEAEAVASVTMDNVRDSLPTRRESDDTRDQLDEKIRAHLDRVEAKADPLLGQMVGGRFLVLKKIGAGGMGSVYRARQEGMERDVAIKVLLADLTQNDTVLRRFTLEALAVSRLRHPNTIQIFDYGQTLDGNPYIAMEMLEGLTLYDLLRKERPLAIRRAMRIMAQVAASLSEAHAKEIVHRDLKPENIFLVKVGDNPDYVKVLDFGVAKLRDHKSDQGTLTQAGSIFGTPRYMSPEQCSAQAVDLRSDLYTLGVILYEMVTGQPPFMSDQALSLLLAHVNDPPVPPSAATDKQVIPAEVEDLILQLLQKFPEDRLNNAGELAKRCEELAAQLPIAFDQCVGTAAEAESLGVRVSILTADSLPTARTMHMAPGALAAGVKAPVLQMPPAVAAPVSALAKGTIGAVALLAAGTVAWALMRAPQVVVQTQIIKEQVTVTLPGAALDEKNVRLTISSNPAGAKILRGDVLLGTTNATLDHAKGTAPEGWKLIRDGFEPYDLEVMFDKSQVLSIDLKKRVEVKSEVTPEPKAEHLRPARAEPRPASVKGDAKPEPKTEVKAEHKPESKATEPKVEPKIEPKKKKDELVDDLQ